MGSGRGCAVDEWDELYLRMKSDIDLGLWAEEDGYLPPMTEEQLEHLAAWLVGCGWKRPSDQEMSKAMREKRDESRGS